MPTRIPTHRPLRLRTAKRQDDSSRPNAAARGYCSRAWYAIRQRVLVRDAWACQACGRVCADKREAHVDHVIPKAAGGQDVMENLRTLCIRCHSRKTAAERGRTGGGSDLRGSV
jgi:5-methylcytosine-specific restriction endonuclease McrA